MKNIPGQVLNELGELGKSIVSETVKIPGSIAGEAIPGSKPPATPQQRVTEAPGTHPTPLDALTDEKDPTRLLGIARKALQYLARPAESQEPTVRERLDREDALKRQQQEKEEKSAAAMAPVAVPKGKKRGDLSGVRQLEKNPNVRQD